MVYIYKQVLIQKNSPKDIFPDPLRRGIELYLNYLNEDSDLIRSIKNSRECNQKKSL